MKRQSLVTTTWAVNLLLFPIGVCQAADLSAWAPVGPEGGWISAFAADLAHPGTVWAATRGGGVFKSIDSGDYWTAASQGLGQLDVTAIAVDPGDSQRLFAGTASRGVFRSADGGATWLPVNAGLPGATTRPKVGALAVHPTDGDIVFAAFSAGRGGLYVSGDGGDSWSPVGSDLPGDVRVYSVAIDPASPSTVYAGTERGAWRSVNGGVNWTQLDTNHLAFSSVVSVAVLAGAAGTIYVATSEDIWKSTDGGDHFSPLPALPPRGTRATSGAVRTRGLRGTIYFVVFAIYYLFVDDLGTSLADGRAPLLAAPSSATAPTLVVATDDGVFVTADDGAHWSRLDEGLSSKQTLTLAEVGVAQPRLLVGTAGAGVYSAGGGAWRSANTGLVASEVTAFGFSGPRTILAAVSGAGIARSTNGGVSWAPANDGGLDDTYVSSLAAGPQAPGVVWAASSSGLFRSDSGGSSWTKVATGAGSDLVNAVAVDPSDPNRVYAGGGGGIRRSLDGGVTWEPASTGMGPRTVTCLAVDPLAPQTLWAGVSSGGLYKSADGAVSWNPANGGEGWLELGVPYAIAVDPLDSMTVYASVDGRAVWKTVNGGATWAQMATGLFDSTSFQYATVSSLAIDPTNPQTVYAGATTSRFSSATSPLGVFVSHDGGATWAALGPALSGTPVLAIGLHPAMRSSIFAGTTGLGAFRLGPQPGLPIRRRLVR